MTQVQSPPVSYPKEIYLKKPKELKKQPKEITQEAVTQKKLPKSGGIRI